MDNKLSELSKPVAYSLRFRNVNGEPDKTINACTTFSTLEKAKAYGLGIRYVTKDDGKIVSVRDPSQDPIVEPLYSQEYVSALLADNEAKDKRIAELETQVNVWQSAAMKHLARAEEAEKRLPILEQDKLRLNEIINSEANRADAAEKLLATPVRLPDVLFIKVSGSAVPVMHAYRVKERVHAAGFTVEGDE